MTRPTETLSCRRCFELVTKLGRFRCKREVDLDPAFEPRTHRTEWLDTPEGKKWARDTARVCPWFNGEEGEVVVSDGVEFSLREVSDGEDE